jgi:hypothetical protein
VLRYVFIPGVVRWENLKSRQNFVRLRSVEHYWLRDPDVPRSMGLTRSPAARVSLLFSSHGKLSAPANVQSDREKEHDKH